MKRQGSVAARCWATLTALAVLPASSLASRVLLIPIDSRPATGQFAQMIAGLQGAEVRLPPYDTLGRYTQAGSPEKILDWLSNQDFSDLDAVVVSTDMIAYGGLIASRVNDVSTAQALARLKQLAEIRARAPKVKFYGFSAIMRLAPTATRATASWRMDLARYAETRERFRATKQAKLQTTLKNLEAKIPKGEIKKYDATRQRDLEVQRDLVRQAQAGVYDFFIFGQDDAQVYGPHVPERGQLRELVHRLGVNGKVQFCEGIDQHANVLISRALLKSADWAPRIRVVYSDDSGRNRVADYESRTIEQSLEDQLYASGARPSKPGQEYDYTLYLNTPDRRDPNFQDFLDDLMGEVDQGLPVSVADIDLAKDGTADPQLFAALTEAGRMIRLLSYAGWNTAGNTIGTAIPAANVYLLARRSQTDPLVREVALREFLLHRYVNDFAYHKFVRPLAYKMIDSSPNATREETYGPAFDSVNEFVRSSLTEYLDTIFKTQFQGRSFFAGSKSYEMMGLDGVKVFLPWPRAYEVRLEFHITVQQQAQTKAGG